MLRITEERALDNSITLRLEGRLVGAWVTLLQTSCERYLLSNCRLSLELSELTFADPAGVALLVELQPAAALIHCSPFLLEQLKPVQTGKLAPQTAPRLDPIKN